MKYYSEITKKFYDDIEELKKDEITTEERELRVFVNVIVKPLYSLEDRKMIIKYMKEYYNI